jgi:exodeoxyribonuclease VII large subunit
VSSGSGATGAPGELTPTWSVRELHEAIDGLLEHVFGDQVWVEGELRNLSRSARQHVYFDLVDPDVVGDANRPMLSVTLFDRERQTVNRFLTAQGGAVRMVDGVRVRIRGRLTTYAARSNLQLRMDWIDPAFTLGVLGQQRERVLAALAADGLLESNSLVPLAVPSLRVALVTSIGSAAHADVLDELQRSALGFRVTVVDARTQGVDAERSLVSALRTAESLGVDVVALVRGGGARTDLAAFDSEALARTIAALQVPVLTGIGHETDRTVADEVAHAAHKTPTACAAALVNIALVSVAQLHDSWVRVTTAAQGRVVRAEQQLDLAGRSAGRAAVRHLERGEQRVGSLADRARLAAPRPPVAARLQLDTLAARLKAAAHQRTTRSAETLDALAARARSHDPVLSLAKGWSVSRASDGSLLRSIDQLAPGEVVTTTLSDGAFTARTESIDEHAGAEGERRTGRTG